MNTEQFAYWMQGFVELHGAPPSAQQWDMIKEHLQTCFKKVTTAQINNVIAESATDKTRIEDIIRNNRTGGPYTVTC